MSGERGEMSGGALLVYALVCIVLLIFAFIMLGRSEDECERRGGTPIVDRTYQVRCVDLPGAGE